MAICWAESPMPENKWPRRADYVADLPGHKSSMVTHPSQCRIRSSSSIITWEHFLIHFIIHSTRKRVSQWLLNLVTSLDSCHRMWTWKIHWVKTNSKTTHLSSLLSNTPLSTWKVRCEFYICSSIGFNSALPFKLNFYMFTDVMVLNDIIEQAAGRQSRASEQGGNLSHVYLYAPYIFLKIYQLFFSIFFVCACVWGWTPFVFCETH